MDIFQTLLQVFGGLAIFIYGVHLLSEGLEKVAGDRFLSILEKAAGNRFKGFIFGTVATAMMQSSGLLMVTMIGLINASLLTLEQAIGIMLGQEIGTTITGQLVAFNIRGFNLLFLIVGFYLMFFNANKKWQLIGQPLFGFGVVFVGMNMMSSAAGSFSQLPIFQDLLLALSRNVFLGVLAGTIFTAAIQSSTAMTGLIIAMGRSNSITLAVAVALILGANIGSCIMGWLASIRSTVNAKRASYAQIFINIGGVILFLPFIAPYTEFISKTSMELPRQIANAHTIFNIIVSLLMIPLVTLMARFVTRIIPEGHEKEEKRLTKYLDERFLNTPFVAVSLAKEEVLRLGRLTLQMLKNSETGYLRGKLKSAQAVLEQEPEIDQISHIVMKFMEDVPADKLNPAEHAVLERLKHLVTDIERVGDHAVNLAEFARQMEKKNIRISKTAHKELKEFFRVVGDTYALSLKAFKNNDLTLIDRVVENEDEVDRMEKKCKRGHVERLRKGECQPEADPIYVETLRNLERISDHSYNIALSLKY